MEKNILNEELNNNIDVNKQYLNKEIDSLLEKYSVGEILNAVELYLQSSH